MQNDPRYLELMLLSVWLGFLGADRFFLARFNRSHGKWAYWKLFTLGGIGIWWLADIIYIASNRTRIQDIVDNKWQWRKYNGRISAAATVTAVLAIILVLWIGPESVVPPQIEISPKSGEPGTTFNVTVSGLRPYSKITETIVRLPDQNVMQQIEYGVSWWGTVTFPVPTSSFGISASAVDYLCKVPYGAKYLSGKFTINPKGGSEPTIFMEAVPGSQGTEFTIEGYQFTHLKRVAYRINKTNANQWMKITEGEININSDSRFSYALTGLKFKAGDYLCQIISNSIIIISYPFSAEPTLPYCVVEPEEGFPTTVFNIRCKGLTARQMATYNIVILNQGWEYQYGAGQENVNNNEGRISFPFKNEQMPPGTYQCRVSDSTQTLTDNFTILPGGCSCLCTEPKEGCCPPDFILETSNNQYVHLKHTCGKMVWIAFWQSSCSTCLDQMKIVQKAYEYWSSKELVILPVNVNESPETVRHFMDDANLTFPVLFDQDQTVTNTYMPRLYPANYFVNQNGIIKKIKFGPISSIAELRDIIDKLK
jgi:peroxiredoxin